MRNEGVELSIRFAHAEEVGMLKITQTAMHDLKAVRRGGAGKVVLLDEGDRKATLYGIPGGTNAEDAPTDDNHIVFLLAQCCDVSSHKGSIRNRSFIR